MKHRKLLRCHVWFICHLGYYYLDELVCVVILRHCVSPGKMRSASLISDSWQSKQSVFLWPLQSFDLAIQGLYVNPTPRFLHSGTWRPPAGATKRQIRPDRLTTSGSDSLFKSSWIHCSDHVEGQTPSNAVRKAEDQQVRTSPTVLEGHWA